VSTTPENFKHHIYTIKLLRKTLNIISIQWSYPQALSISWDYPFKLRTLMRKKRDESTQGAQVVFSVFGKDVHDRTLVDIRLGWFLTFFLPADRQHFHQHLLHTPIKMEVVFCRIFSISQSGSAVSKIIGTNT
jgi:hypothetical protein